MTTRTRIAAATLLVAAPFIAVSPLLIGGIAPAPQVVLASVEAPLQEDDPGWSCAASGDRVCGPLGDDLGHAPGCYNDTGALVAPWPCHVVANTDGSSDVYEGLAIR